MPLSPKQSTLRARLAATTRHHPDADASKLRTELRTETAAEYIRRLVDEAPPLSDDQRNRLASILRPARKAADAA
jgi:hypothetical protein